MPEDQSAAAGAGPADEVLLEILDSVQIEAVIQPDWGGPDQRRWKRHLVQGVRSIALRRADVSGRFSEPWIVADILDISEGGLGLLVSGALQLQPGDRLMLDLRAHPAFEVEALPVDVRWTVCSETFTTLGVAFPAELAAVPALALERRQARRDPEEHSWSPS